MSTASLHSGLSVIPITVLVIMMMYPVMNHDQATSHTPLTLVPKTIGTVQTRMCTLMAEAPPVLTQHAVLHRRRMNSFLRPGNRERSCGTLSLGMKRGDRSEERRVGKECRSR